MKLFVALVINLVVLVQISQSHTIESTVKITYANRSDNVVPEMGPHINSYFEEKISTDVLDSITTTIKQSKKRAAPPKEDELVFAHVIYRHGTSDMIKHIELTNEGKMHLYRLGQYFHKRYGKLIGEGFQLDKIYVVSSDHDRTIMSAQVNLAGMFEPNESEKWHQNITWQPIPVHTLPMQLDNIIRPQYDGRCPRYDKLYAWYMKESPEAKEMYRKYGKYFKFWAKASGRKVEDLERIFSMFKQYTDLKHQNETIPEWADRACAPGGPMNEISKTVFQLRAKPDLVRIHSGYLLKEILERFKAKQNHELDPDRAVYMYSGHSSTVNSLLNGLGFSVPFPDNGFSILFEMYKTPEDKYYLQIFLRQPDDENPKPENIKKYGNKFSPEQFYEVYRELIPGEFDLECGLKKPGNPQADGGITATPNAATSIGNSRAISIVLCSLLLIHKSIS